MRRILLAALLVATVLSGCHHHGGSNPVNLSSLPQATAAAQKDRLR